MAFGLYAQTASPEAVKAYQEKKYSKAAELLQKEVDTHKKLGEESSALFYNLGNAYFRSDELAKAILYYERALLLDPGNKDIRHNIAYANTKVEDADKIAKTENIFIQNWFESLENVLSSDTWSMLAIIFFLLTMVCCFFFFFGKRIWIKKVAFYSGIGSLTLVVLFNLFAYLQLQDVTRKNTAIVMTPTAQLVSSPDEKSKVLINIHAGLKVRITKTDGEWYEVEIDNGTIGWIQADKLEII
jgi:tetratricopeptide (TPR) repeat protein